MKRLLILLLILTFSLSTVALASNSSASITGTQTTVSPGTTVAITLTLADNPGIASCTIDLSWDRDNLSLDPQSLALGTEFSDGLFAANTAADGIFRIAWASLENVTANGTIATLSFTVGEDIDAGTYPITASIRLSDENGTSIPLSVSNASITVPAPTPSDPPASDNTSEPPSAAPVTPSPTPVQPEHTFTDMSENAYYYHAAVWAAQNNITTGTSETTFSPDAPCSRAQAVTFLWRAEGCPEPSSPVNPFTDISPDAYYYKAVLWAVERGITKGTGDGSTFSPNTTCTRAQIVTFLYRNVQANGGGFQGTWMFYIPFRDMPGWAFEPIAWCYMKGITTGTSETTFSPDQPCTRGQIVTFLYRSFAAQEN